MFAKIFESIYDGTLADNWQAMVVFQQLLILSDQQGVVDMTPAAIHRRTGIPVEIIKAGIEALEQPDPQSRTKDMEGRRIVRLSEHRDWGWFLVNHGVYRAKINAEEKREADRVRIANRRDAERHVADCREVSRGVAEVAHTDADTEAEKLSKPSGKEVEHVARPTLEPPSPPTAEPVAKPTAAGEACKALRAAGVAQVNPSHPKLLALIAAGVTPQEIHDCAKSALEKGKGNFPYVLAMIESQRKEAAGMGAIPAAAAKPKPAAHTPYVKPLPASPQQLFKDHCAWLDQQLRIELITDEEHAFQTQEARERMEARAGPPATTKATNPVQPSAPP